MAAFAVDSMPSLSHDFFFICVDLCSSVVSSFAPGTPPKPNDGGEHSDPAQCTDERPDLRVVFEYSRVRKEIKPVVLGQFRVAHGHVLEALASRVGHVYADWQKLLNEKDRAVRRDQQLALEYEISCESERDEQLQKRSPGDHQPLAKVAEQKMPALVNGNKNQVEPLEQCPVQNRVPNQDGVECQRCDQRASRHGLPLFLQCVEKRKSFDERFRNSHARSILLARTAG